MKIWLDRRRYGSLGILCIVALLSSCSSGGTLSKEDIKIAAGELRTFAHSAALLIDQAASTTDIFFRAQTEDLSDKVRSTAKDLDKNGGENEAMRGRAAHIASGLADDISRLHEDKQHSAEVKDAIDKLGQEAKSIEDQLRQ